MARGLAYSVGLLLEGGGMAHVHVVIIEIIIAVLVVLIAGRPTGAHLIVYIRIHICGIGIISLVIVPVLATSLSCGRSGESLECDGGEGLLAAEEAAYT
jgi:hypothetical protein